MSDSKYLKEFANYVTSIDLPVGVYLVDINGSVVDCNRFGREMLQLPLGGPLSSDARMHHETEYFVTIQDALSLRNSTSGQTVKQLKINDQERFVREQRSRVESPKTGELLGYVCCVVMHS